jgi:benzylsuccinate CoA-transferase BbsF subunit
MLVGESVLQALRAGDAPRVGAGHELWSPHGVYPALGADRWIAVAVRSDEEWAGLVDAMGRPEWCTPDLASEAGRRERREEVDRYLGAWTATREARELAAELQAAGVCAEASMNAQDIADDEHLRERGGVVTLRHPEHGERIEAGAPWRFALANVGYERWSPDLGEHNEEVICGLLSHSREELERWAAEGAVD